VGEARREAFYLNEVKPRENVRKSEGESPKPTAVRGVPGV